MALPPRKSTRTSVILPEASYLRIQRLAEINDVSTAWVIRHAIQKFLDSHEHQTELPLRLPKDQSAPGER